MTGKHPLLFVYISLLLCSWAYGQSRKKDKTTTVYAKIEVLMEGEYSKKALNEYAIKAAKIKALGEAFGYVIVQGINTQTESVSGNEVYTSSKVSEVSNTLVKGEWVADASGYPKTMYTIREKGDKQEIWLICEVKGEARELQEAAIDFEAYPFNCQEPEKCRDGIFRNHDSMYLYFKTSVSGYLSVFMLEDGLVYRLLPYANMQQDYEKSVPVMADQEYYLFHPEYRDYFEGFALVDEYGLTTYEDGSTLSNMIYIAFSPEPFQKPLLSEKEGIKYTELEDFQKWMNKTRTLNKNFQVKQYSILIKP